VVCFEFEAYPEPKMLTSKHLKALYERYGTYVAAGNAIGASEGFVRQSIKIKE
jgi:hypothetical protein